VLQVASLEAPRMGQLRNELSHIPDGTVYFIVLRDGKEIELQATIRDGLLGVLLVNALDIPRIAQPISQELVQSKEVATAISKVQLVAGAQIVSIQGKPVEDWKSIRRALIDCGNSAQLEMRSSLNGNTTANVSVAISEKEHAALVELGWNTPLKGQFFEPIYVNRHSGGNPIKALTMGFHETVNTITMTYLTIDRLLRRTVGVDQLRGPVGIVHVGAKIADRGFSYLLSFLAIISVNLAVLNFLPLPIVDGGLFLYLIYEKMFKKPPSVAFQNTAAVFGLGLIAMLFIVTFYNDIMRIVV
jgi:regulator of sigma E protease